MRWTYSVHQFWKVTVVHVFNFCKREGLSALEWFIMCVFCVASLIHIKGYSIITYCLVTNTMLTSSFNISPCSSKCSFNIKIVVKHNYFLRQIWFCAYMHISLWSLLGFDSKCDRQYINEKGPSKGTWGIWESCHSTK